MLTLDEIQTAIMEWIRDKPFIQKVYLEGSYARGDQTDSSDIDLMIHLIDELDDQQEFFTYHDNRASWSVELKRILDFEGPIQIHCFDLLSDEWRAAHLRHHIVLFERKSAH